MDGEDELDRALVEARVRALSGDVLGASDALSEHERASGADELRRARACVDHAALLLELAAKTPRPTETLAWRERALRKAARAMAITGRIAPEGAVRTSALRAHTDALRSLPGREKEWQAQQRVLIAALERAPGDTRLERARRWLDLGGMTTPWGYDDERSRWTRRDAEPAESAMRAALSLYLELGTPAREVVDAIAALVNLLTACSAARDAEALSAELAPRLSPEVLESLRARVGAWGVGAEATKARLEHLLARAAR